MVMTVCMDRVFNVLCCAFKFVSNNANLSIRLEIKLRCNCFVAVDKNRFCTPILIVDMYNQMIFPTLKKLFTFRICIPLPLYLAN